MGTASTMNAVSEALGMSLPGQAAIPAPYRERPQMAYETGKRIVEMAYEDLRPSRILTRASFLNAIRLVTAIGGTSNAQPHIVAMARLAGAVEAFAEIFAGRLHVDQLGQIVTIGHPVVVAEQPAGV